MRKNLNWILNRNLENTDEAGKQKNLKKKMERLRMDVLGISKVRWPEVDDWWSG